MAKKRKDAVRRLLEEAVRELRDSVCIVLYRIVSDLEILKYLEKVDLDMKAVKRLAKTYKNLCRVDEIDEKIKKISDKMDARKTQPKVKKQKLPPQRPQRKEEEQKEYPLKFMTEAEYKRLYPKKKKPGVQLEDFYLAGAELKKPYPKKRAVVFFHKSDFMTLDEYITAMEKPPISDEEVAKTDWDKLARRIQIK